MKIIITESQYRILQESDKIKRIVNTMLNDDELSIDEIMTYTGLDEREIIELLGGWDKMIEKAYQLMDRTFDTMDYDFSGGYDFRFKVQRHSDYEEDMETLVDCSVESDGKVTLMDNMETHYLKDLEGDYDLWWEIDSEIRSLIEDILYKEVTKKTGIRVDINNCWIEE
jgi:uncharacterized surface anchored protein